MNKAQRLTYIFNHHANSPVGARFPWLENALLGDIQTFIDGVDLYVKKKKKAARTKPRGGGNVSIPIPVNTALELASALYTGKTKYTMKRKPTGPGRYRLVHDFNATSNVAEFVGRFFPSRSKHIPQILWDGIRNGVDHTFAPKTMRRGSSYIQFQFIVEPKSTPSAIHLVRNNIVLQINSLEYFRVVKRAIAAYKRELQTDTLLQRNFIRAWRSYERHIENLDKDREKRPEANYLRTVLSKSNHRRLFQ